MNLKRSLRERKFIEAYIKHKGDATKAYLEINPKCKRASASVLGLRMLRKVKISASELLDRIGGTDYKFDQRLVEGLDATKVVSVVPIPPRKDKPGSVDLPDAGGSSIEFIDIPDFGVRLKYIELGNKLKGRFPTPGVRIEGHQTFTVKGVDMSRYPK